MSWDAYVDNMVAQGCASGGLFDINGGTAWHSAATNKGITADAAEMKMIIDSIKGGSFATGSCKMGGVKFSLLRLVPGESALVKNNDGDKPICYVLLSKQCVVVATMTGPGERGVVGVVDKLVEYLAGMGY